MLIVVKERIDKMSEKRKQEKKRNALTLNRGHWLGRAEQT
jgi:hypothetical protein